MPIHINSNVAYARATADFTRVERDSEVRRARLASGLGINKASDGSGQLGVSEGMRAEIGGLVEGSRNAENAMDLLNTAEGAMNEISSILIRMRELSVGSVFDNGQVASGTSEFNFDRLGIEVELAGAGVTGSSGSYVDGELNGKIIEIAEGTGGSFQLGSDARPADRIEYSLPEMSTGSPIINLTQVSVGTRDSARLAIGKVDAAIERTTKARGEIGAVTNRLDRTISFTTKSIERVTASESTVRDADYAWETSLLARNEIVAQSSSNIMLKSQVAIEMVMGLLTQ